MATAIARPIRRPALRRPSPHPRWPPSCGRRRGTGRRRPARSSATARGAAAPDVVRVTLESDEDLDRFVRSLAARCEDARERRALQEGARRFALGRAADAAARGPCPAPEGGAIRVERGAVTERTVKDAAAAGARLVLAPRAVLTPLAREKARALGIEIERERRC